MNGFERLKEQVNGQKDAALNAVVDYLLSRDDMQKYYLDEKKTLEGMTCFIKDKAKAHSKGGWSYVTNEVVYSWALMYYSLPDEFLKIKSASTKKETTKKEKDSSNKNNVVSIEEAKEKVTQLSLFGGVA